MHDSAWGMQVRKELQTHLVIKGTHRLWSSPQPEQVPHTSCHHKLEKTIQYTDP